MLGLGIVALVTGPVLAGVIPATVALVLAREARTDLRAAGGFLVGGRRLRVGCALAWGGILLAVASAVVMAIVGLLALAATVGGRDYAPTVN